MPIGERFSWEKFFNGLTSALGWVKFASFWLKVLMVAVPILTGVWAYKATYAQGYAKGAAVTRALADQEFKQWIADHPQQTISGSTVNNNVAKVNNRFQLRLIPPLLGWCE